MPLLKEINLNKMSNKYQLKFMKPFRELFVFKKQIDKYMREIHPIKPPKEYLNFVSRNIKYKNLSKEMKLGQD